MNHIVNSGRALCSGFASKPGMTLPVLLSLGIATTGLISIAHAADHPNVLVIVADDMGSADIKPYGGEIPTPALDGLAKDGLTLTNFHTNASCSPTRSMLLSGVDNHLNGFGTMAGRLKNPPAAPQVGKPGYEGHLNDRVITIANVMKDAGYHTYMSGKWHMGEQDGYRPAQRGFEESYALIGGGYIHYQWDEMRNAPPSEDTTFDFRENDIPVDRWPDDFYTSKNFTDKMIEYIDKHQKDDKPFFGFLTYTAPHSPLQAPDEYIAKYAKRYQGGWDKLRAERFSRQKKLGLVPKNMKLPPLRGNGFVSWDSLSSEQKKIDAKKMAIYAGMIDYMDESIGRLVDHLKEIGEYENTIIVFMSDNGPEANNLSASIEPLFIQAGVPIDNSLANLGKPSSFVSPAPGFAVASALPSFGAKASVAEGGIRNNFIVSYPNGIKNGGRQVTAFSTVLDVLPTLVDYAGATYPATYNNKPILPLNGKSMRAVWEGAEQRVHPANEAIGVEVFGSANRSLFQGDWKIMCLGDAPWGAGVNQQWQLFNLKTNRAETTDLAKRYPAKLQQMVSLYNEYASEVGFVPSLTGQNACGSTPPATSTPTKAAKNQGTPIPFATVESVPSSLSDVFSDDF